MPVVTALKAQQRDKNRVNVYLDGVYSFSLDVSQVLSLGVRSGREYTDEQIMDIRQESEFGKLYGRALEYALMRPRSEYELKQYLYRKTRPTMTKTGERRPGYGSVSADRVYAQVVERGYVNDTHFAQHWVAQRRLKKGASRRLLKQELAAKGVSGEVVEAALAESMRDEHEELRKVVARVSRRYSDKQKLMQYLVRQGFSYGDVTEELSGWGG